MKKVLILTVVLGLLLAGCRGITPPTTEPTQETEPAEEVVLTSLKSDNTVTCPFVLEGEARGNWFFEATLSVRLEDESGNAFFQKAVMTEENWMTEDFVSFNEELYFQTEAQSGQLIIVKANPSGLEENANEVAYDVSFQSCSNEQMDAYTKTRTKEYIENNIVALSPVEAVLGGTWVVTSIEFLEDNKVKVVYEDGHIEETVTASYHLDEYDNIIVEIIES